MSRKSLAVVCRELNAPVVVEEIQVDPPGPNEVTIDMRACGVCHSDLSATNGTIQVPPPAVLGHEGAGVVVEVGSAVTEFAVGDHVLSSFVSMCGKCRYCVIGRPSLCDQAGRTFATLPDGSLRTRDANGEPLNVFSGCGVMAEYATLHVDNVVAIDRSVPLEHAALIGCGVMTGVGAVTNTAKVEPGSTAVVFGVGGVGLNVVQACSIAGATTIVAVDTSPAKLEMATAFGATHTFDPRQEGNVVRSIRAVTGGGADYSFECVGNGEIVAQAYGVLGKGGTAVVVGIAPPKDVTTIRTSSLTFQEKTLTGSYFGSARPRDDFPRIVSLYQAGRLKLKELVTRTYRIEEAPEAFADLAAGRNARGVILFG
jgi:NDMA-dependent alcohol dehydrogenase